ncbi:PREDICTED: auxin-responsive protein IAA10-like [Camelina sativa]|uniref:Auxin-responsive protein n=1 Tax=Camelina sativa TaxID=90675 RepID=A0ABM1RIE3_CAMSA|nr:PREDICTED: auxin-responsive protein IAA10-like [Camelina sativa]
MNGFGDVCSSSGSVMIGEDDNAALSSEDSSCPEESVSETELDLALGLSIGLKGRRKVRSSLSSSSSSLTRESGTKRSADSSAAASNATRQVAIGWPPLRTYRINSLVNQAKSLVTEGTLSSDIPKDTTKIGVVAAKKDDDSFIKSIRTSMLVKVTMDGVIIGRKVDLNALESYEALAKTLEQMFFQIPSSVTGSNTQVSKKIKETQACKLLDGSSEYIITYQDKDGDWMLVGDVPWQMFLGSVKRLRIMKTSSETGVGAYDQ